MSFTIHFFGIFLGVASNQLLMKIVALAVFWKVSSLTRTCIMKNHDSIDILRYPWSNSTTYIMSSNLNIKDVSISMKASSHLKLTLEPVSSSCSNGQKKPLWFRAHGLRRLTYSYLSLIHWFLRVWNCVCLDDRWVCLKMGYTLW